MPSHLKLMCLKLCQEDSEKKNKDSDTCSKYNTDLFVMI